MQDVVDILKSLFKHVKFTNLVKLTAKKDRKFKRTYRSILELLVTQTGQIEFYITVI